MRGCDGQLLYDTLLQKRYKIINLIHTGPVSKTYKGIDIKDNSYVFIKEVITDYRDPSLRYQAIEQFKDEAKILFKLKHENLPKFKDYFDFDNNRYLIIEYIEGDRLDTLIEKQENFLSEKESINWSIQLCEALSYLHNTKPHPVIFRNMTPWSIIVSKDGKLKLMDFGISKIYEYGASTRSIAKTISRYYSPLEQHGGITDTRSDIYSLGATIYYLITVEHPMDCLDRTIDDEPIKSCREINSNISSNLEQIIMKAMEIDKENRYQHIEEMKRDLIKISRTGHDLYGRIKDSNFRNTLELTDKPLSDSSIKINLPPKERVKPVQEEKKNLKSFTPRNLTPSKEISNKLREMRSINKKHRKTEESPELQFGKLIRGTYKITELIKTGHLSKVYKGIDIEKDDIISIKEFFYDIYLKSEERKEIIDQLHSETGDLINLHHQNLPVFEDYFYYEGKHYLIMEYINGENLTSIIEDFVPPWEIVLEWTYQLCDVLAYLHSRKPKPVIFRGLCPDNIILEYTGKIKLIDFGMSKLYDRDEKTISVAKVANANFSPPEQYSGHTDKQSDIYSLGATMYYLLTGILPNDSVDRVISNIPLAPEEFNRNIPAEIKELIFRSTEIDKNKRFHDMLEIKKYVEAISHLYSLKLLL
jgi:serine/threonine protein kinase